MRTTLHAVIENSVAGVGNRAVYSAWEEFSLVESLHTRFVDDVTEEKGVGFERVLNQRGWRIIMPGEFDTLFVLDYHNHVDDIKGYAGAAYPRRCSVVIYGGESDVVLKLRVVHELLHSMGLPADDLDKYHPKFLVFWWRWIYRWLKRYGAHPEQIPFFQERYYHWLLANRSGFEKQKQEE